MFKRKKVLRKICHYDLCDDKEMFDKIFVCDFGGVHIHYGLFDGLWYIVNIESKGGKICYTKADVSNVLYIETFLDNSKKLSTTCKLDQGLWIMDYIK